MAYCYRSIKCPRLYTILVFFLAALNVVNGQKIYLTLSSTVEFTLSCLVVYIISYSFIARIRTKSESCRQA